MILDKISYLAGQTAESFASLVKTVLLSRRPSRRHVPRQRSLTIMGNGPSLRKALEENPELFADNDLLAVNFAPNSEEFFSLRPAMLVLADGHFFTPDGSDPNVTALWKNIVRADWPLTLWIPASRRSFTKKYGLTLPTNINVGFFNLTPVGGFRILREFLYDTGAGMPRPRNVLIPSIMIAVREGYRRIFLTGADHSWSKTLWVDSLNRVVSIQPHYYKDNSQELDRVAAEYAGYHIHDIYNSLAIAFRSYHMIAPWAGRRGVEIINASQGSFIDAFPRLVSVSDGPDADPKQ